jgi:uncharacterized protein YijF (DUF1287 family)
LKPKITMKRRTFLGSIALAVSSPTLFARTPTSGERLAAAAQAQLGVTLTYDPSWVLLKYPGGDVDRSKGVCADVVIRAGRDGLGLDLQKLVHEDIAAHFDAYPARRTWGEHAPDTSIDHRRVLNLQTYFERCGCQIWRATRAVAGDLFPIPLADGDILTWLLDARLPHIGIVALDPQMAAKGAYLVHNIGDGVKKWALPDMSSHRAVGHYRWPKS